MQALSQSGTASRLSFAPPRPQADVAVGSVLLSVAVPELGETATLAHDAANILSALLLYCDLLQQPGVLRKRHLHYAQELNDLARRSSGLVGRLLDQLSDKNAPASAVRAQSDPSAGSGRATLAGRAYSPNRKLRELEPLLRSLAFPYALLDLELGDRLPEWTTPPAETLERMVVNLVCNAAQAMAPKATSGAFPPWTRHGDHQQMEPEGRITVILRRSGGRTVMEVADNGPGITAEMAAAFLLPSDPLSGPERGLGHRIVHELAAATGARLAVRSRPGHGTTFSLSWQNQRPAESATSEVPRKEQNEPIEPKETNAANESQPGY